MGEEPFPWLKDSRSILTGTDKHAGRSRDCRCRVDTLTV